MTEQIFSILLVFMALPFAVLLWVIFAHNQRAYRARTVARSIPESERSRIRDLIASAAANNCDCTILYHVPESWQNNLNAVTPATKPAVSHATSIANSQSVETNSKLSSPNDLTRTESHFGGIPYGEAGETWPKLRDDQEDPADFLIQVRLCEPLPPVWHGRLITVFLKYDEFQTVRCYESPSIERFVPLTALSPEIASSKSGNKPTDEAHLTPCLILNKLPIPKLPNRNPELPCYSPHALLSQLPELKDAVSSLTSLPVDLISQLLTPDRYGYDVDESSMIRVGGLPFWKQFQPGSLKCPECGAPQRFLFQFPDLARRNRFGRSGLCYIFGCDDHPLMVQGFIQTS